MILLVVVLQLVGEPGLQVLLRLRRVHGDEARHLGGAGAAGVRGDAGSGDARSAAADAHGAERHGAVAAHHGGCVAAGVAEPGARVERRRPVHVHGGVAVQAQPGDAPEAEDDGVMHRAGPAAVEWQGHMRARTRERERRRYGVVVNKSSQVIMLRLACMAIRPWRAVKQLVLARVIGSSWMDPHDSVPCMHAWIQRHTAS